MSRTRRQLSLALISGIAFLLLWAMAPTAGATSSLLGKQGPGFVLKDGAGKNVDLAAFKGKVVLVNFWATWCGPCKVEIPWFVEFDRTYRDRGFAVIGVSMDADDSTDRARTEAWAVVKPFLQEKHISYPIVLGDESVAQRYGGIESLPASFLLDRSGKVVAVHNGLVSKGTYEADIKKALGGR
jgi:thiol-disulfide isomerase/thioredoxin